MRPAWIVVGSTVVVIGVLLILFPYIAPTSATIPQYPSGVIETPQIIGSATLTIKWSGASNSAWVSVYKCTSPACSSVVGQVANVSGSSGSISLSVASGNSYLVTASEAVPATVGISGVTFLTIIGAVVAVIGGAVEVLGWIRPRRSDAPSAPAAPSAPRPRAAASSAASDAPVEDMGEVMVAAPSPAALTVGNRPELKCSYCGTMNEPWITNCRKCKRPLATTGR